MSDADADRRQHVRRALRVNAQVLLPGNQTFDVRTFDVGQGGMGIVASANPRSGTTFTISFPLPKKPTGFTPMQLKVKVVHSVLAADSGGFKLGLQFVSVDAASEAAIRQFLV